MLLVLQSSNVARIHLYLGLKNAESFIKKSQIAEDLEKISLGLSSISRGVLALA